MREVIKLRRQLGWLLLWALLPLPFMYIVLPPFWLAAGAAAVWLVLWPQRIPSPSRWLLNLVAVGILVIVVMTGGLNVGPLRPLGHLLLLLTSVRVVMVRDWQAFLRSLALVGMVWVVSVASSTHMMTAGYFLASAAIGWWVGVRVHLAGLGMPVEDRQGPLPRTLHIVTAVAVAVAIAIPFFLVMPRLGSPWVAGRSFGRTTGFSPDVDLGKMGRLTVSQEVALTVRSADGAVIRDEWTRLRGTAFDQVMPGSFIPRRTELRALEPSRGVVWLRSERPPLDSLVELEVNLLRPRRYLMLPPGVVAVQASVPMALDTYGGVLIGYRRGRPLSYRMWVGEPKSPEMAPPTVRDVLLPRGNPEVRALAETVAGDLSSARARADAIERFLQDEYAYSLSSGVEISNSDPVAWFLLEGREGHCEFFAGAMVVLLRHLDVPARMVAGYSGGDLSPGRDELVVRQANAHAWVEVWLGDEQGWVGYDPTPPVGVPGLGRVSGTERLRWIWQRVEMFWDQRLLSFGLGEQLDIIEGAGELLRAVRRVGGGRAGQMVLLAVTIAAGLIGLAWWWGRPRRRRLYDGRRRGPASRAVGRLARAIVSVGGVAPPWATMRRIGDQAALFWPESGDALAELVERAEIELYGHGTDDDAAEVRRLWKSIRKGMKQRRRARGRPQVRMDSTPPA